MHRSISTCAILDDVVYCADFSGLMHCLSAKPDPEHPGQPKVHWTYDMLSACWGSPLIVEGKVYLGAEDGDNSFLRHSCDQKQDLRDTDGEMEPYYGTRTMGASVYSTPVVAGNVLYIANQTHLFAISEGGK
jgi:hypothetical protein